MGAWGWGLLGSQFPQLQSPDTAPSAGDRSLQLCKNRNCGAGDGLTGVVLSSSLSTFSISDVYKRPRVQRKAEVQLPSISAGSSAVDSTNLDANYSNKKTASALSTYRHLPLILIILDLFSIFIVL